MTEKNIKAIVEGVFERIGFDLCHYPTISGLSDIVEKIISLVESLGESVQGIAQKTQDGKLEVTEMAEIVEDVMPKIKDIVSLGRLIADMEFDRICEDVAKELYGAASDVKKKLVADYLNASFVRQIVDYLIMTLLRNAKEVFKDEIEYIRLKASLVSSKIQDLASEAESGFKSLQSEMASTLEGVDHAEEKIESLLGDRLEEFKQVCQRLGKDVNLEADDKSFEKVAKYFSSTFAILDFLGLIHQKQVNLKLPKQMVQALANVSKNIQKASSEIQEATTDASAKARKATSELTGAIREELGASMDALNLSQGAILTFSSQLSRLVTTSGGSVSQVVSQGEAAVCDALDDLQNFSYPIQIPVIRWNKLEDLFTHPVDYFKELYPIDDVQDVQELVAKILDILHGINPDIPDFASLSGLLESLLEKLQKMVIEAGKEALKEIWEKLEPVITIIRKVIDMTREMGKALQSQMKDILDQFEKNLEVLSSRVVNALEGTAQDLDFTLPDVSEGSILFMDAAKQAKTGIVREMSQISITLPTNTLFESIYKDVLKPVIKESLLDGLDLSEAQTEKVLDELLNSAQTRIKKWADDIYKDIKDTLSPQVWKERLHTLLAQLREELKNDTAALQGLVSPKGLSNAIRTKGASVKSLKDTLDISSYITIIKEAAQEVMLPDPSLYYQSFVTLVQDLLEEALQKLGNAAGNDIKAFKEDLESHAENLATLVWDRFKKKVIGKALDTIKAAILGEARYLIRLVINHILESVGNSQDMNLLPTLSELSDIQDTLKDNAQSATSTLPVNLNGVSTAIKITKEMVQWAQDIVSAALTFSSSAMGFKDVLALALSIFRSIPEDVREAAKGLLPPMPDFLSGMDKERLSQIADSAGMSADLDGKFLGVTLLNLKKEEDSKSVVASDSSLSLNLFFLLGTYDKAKETNPDAEIPALYCMICLKGNLHLVFPIGKSHELELKMDGTIGEMLEKDAEGISGIGLALTPKNDITGGYFHPIYSKDAISGMVTLGFERTSKDPWCLFDTKYAHMEIGNYPQYLYVGYDGSYPAILDELMGTENKDGGGEHCLQAGYFGALKDVKFLVRISELGFLSSILKDDVSVDFSTFLWYDFQKGFKLGGDVRLHLEFDLDHKKIGPLTMDSFLLDFGTSDDKPGTLSLSAGSTFQVNLSSAVTLAIEDLGLGFNLNYLKEDGSLGDWDLRAQFDFPTGIGVAIDSSAVKGAGYISIDRKTGEFLGVLALEVVGKFGVGGFLMCDPGTAEGHHFSLVTLISAHFSPGIPLGMGFSLTGIGGCLGLNRMISRDGVRNGVRNGTINSVFFVEDISNHLSEMKSSILEYFPDKKNQFFVGLLGQISFEPVLKCNFGLLLQLPKPTEIIIVGGLNVSLEDTDVIKINVYFSGGINFEEGLWFDASIVDSKIVGISLEGDMAFRLYWGGKCKGFLMSIGGFHPAYKPEPGMAVSDMKRLALRLDYSILKISLETYLAITSNTFQIGARLDLKIGWDKFGLTGYAGFDALFQFNPFMFMFEAYCGVAVKCGSWKLLSIDLDLNVQGPAPWKVAGKAHFYFLFIPIKVNFSKSWGKDTPELEEKLIDVWPIFLEEVGKARNWAILENSLGEQLVILKEQEKKDEEEKEEIILAHPFSSVRFNQTALPLWTKDALERLDICDNARCKDFDSLSIDHIKLQDETFRQEDGSLEILQNDFAPALYKQMDCKQRLSSTSYVQYNSGFELAISDRYKSSSDASDVVMARTVSHVVGKKPSGSTPKAQTVITTRSLRDVSSSIPLRQGSRDSLHMAAKDPIMAGGIRKRKTSKESLVRALDRRLTSNSTKKVGTLLKEL